MTLHWYCALTKQQSNFQYVDKKETKEFRNKLHIKQLIAPFLWSNTLPAAYNTSLEVKTKSHSDIVVKQR